MKKSLISNRRQFLTQASSAIGGAALALSSGKKSWYAFAEGAQQRPNLVVVHCGGGWDSNWFHDAFPARYANFPASEQDSLMLDATTGALTGYATNRYTERAADAQGNE